MSEIIKELKALADTQPGTAWHEPGVKTVLLSTITEIERLRLALAEATRELDEIRATGGTSLSRLATAERERDEAIGSLRETEFARDAALSRARETPAPLNHVAFLTGLPVELNSLLPEGSIFVHPRTFNGLPAEHPSWLDRMRAEAKKVTSALDGDGRDGFNGSGPFEG